MILPAGDNQQAKVSLSRNRGTGGKVTMSARYAKALIGAVPRRRFAYFAAAGKVGRPAGRNLFNLKSSLKKRRYLRAGVVPGQNLVVGTSRLGHGVGPVLAHAHPVAVAGDGKGKVGPIPGHGKAG